MALLTSISPRFKTCSILARKCWFKQDQKLITSWFRQIIINWIIFHEESYWRIRILFPHLSHWRQTWALEGNGWCTFPRTMFFPTFAPKNFSPTFGDNKCQKQPTDAAAAASAVSHVVLLRLGKVLRLSCFFLSCLVPQLWLESILSERHKMPRLFTYFLSRLVASNLIKTKGTALN